MLRNITSICIIITIKYIIVFFFCVLLFDVASRKTGWLADWLNRRRACIYLAVENTAAIVIVIYYLRPLHTSAVCVLCVCLCASSSVQMISFRIWRNVVTADAAVRPQQISQPHTRTSIDRGTHCEPHIHFR